MPFIYGCNGTNTGASECNPVSICNGRLWCSMLIHASLKEPSLCSVNQRHIIDLVCNSNIPNHHQGHHDCRTNISQNGEGVPFGHLYFRWSHDFIHVSNQTSFEAFDKSDATASESCRIVDLGLLWLDRRLFLQQLGGCFLSLDFWYGASIQFLVWRCETFHGSDLRRKRRCCWTCAERRNLDFWAGWCWHFCLQHLYDHSNRYQAIRLFPQPREPWFHSTSLYCLLGVHVHLHHVQLSIHGFVPHRFWLYSLLPHGGEAETASSGSRAQRRIDGNWLHRGFGQCHAAASLYGWTAQNESQTWNELRKNPWKHAATACPCHEKQGREGPQYNVTSRAKYKKLCCISRCCMSPPRFHRSRFLPNRRITEVPTSNLWNQRGQDSNSDRFTTPVKSYEWDIFWWVCVACM